MKCSEIHIRDPFVLYEGGKYYMYGTRAANFGKQTGGFDVYVSDDLETWSEPHPCFDSAAYGLNTAANWAPEVHKYKDAYYMFATFTREKEKLRATFAMKADNPMGPFLPHSNGPLTPVEWECLDGTLYINREGKPYLVFCHEHTQIIDGTVCYLPLSDDLSEAAGDVITMFAASTVPGVGPMTGGHFVTDGPFFHRTESGALYMLWSSFVKGKYAECVVKFGDGELNMNFEHLPPLLDEDGGHGMIFEAAGKTYFTMHAPNRLGEERPCFMELAVDKDHISMKK